MSSSPKQPYQSQIDILSDRPDRQDARFDQLEAKIDKLTRAFDKLPMFDQSQTPPQFSPELLVGGNDRRQWVVYKSSRANELEERELEPATPSNPRMQGEGSNLRHDQGDHRNRQFHNPRDDRRTGNHREPRHADLETDRRRVHEGYFDITRKVKVDVRSFDEKIDATTFSDWIVAMEDYFDWYEMSDIERVRFAKMKLIGPARKF